VSPNIHRKEKMLQRRTQPTFLSEFFDEPLMGGVQDPFGLSLLGDERMDTSEMNRWVPQTDISETDKSFNVTLSLPGMTKEDVHVELDDDNRLRVWGEYKHKKKEDIHKYHRVERQYGKFERVLTLPKRIDPEHISANVEHGVLTVHVPKVEKHRKEGRQISVQ
jgi:HSP20 family protein